MYTHTSGTKVYKYMQITVLKSYGFRTVDLFSFYVLLHFPNAYFIHIRFLKL